MTKEESIPAGHNWNDGITTTYPECTKTGEVLYTCLDCGETKTEVIPVQHRYSIAAGINANCTAGGWALLTCSLCGEQHYEEYEPLGHDLVRHEAQAASCEAIGWDAYDACTRCDYTTYAEIPATGHDYVGTETTAATCTTDGVMTYVCKNDASHSYTESIPALGHDPVLVQYVAPTQTSSGIEIFVCSRCSFTSSNILPMITYIPGDINDDGVVNAKDITTLRRFLAGGYDATVNESFVDVNKDGAVNAKDITTLRRYLAGGYGIEL